MNFSITPAQEELQFKIIEFCKNELNTNSEEEKQPDLTTRWKKCALQHLTALPVDTHYGGAGLDPISTILALEAFGYGCEDGGLTFSVAAHLLATVIPIWKYGTEEQKARLLPALCNGDKMGANAITEDENGSDVFNMTTTATLYNDSYQVNGTKSFISNGVDAQTLLVYALTNKSKGFFGGVTPFIISNLANGFNVEKTYDKMGLTSCSMAQLKFDNVVVTKNNLLGEEGSGGTIFNYSMDWERIGLAAVHIGIMQRLLGKTIEFAKSRLTQGEPLSKKQTVAHKISDMKVRLEAGRILTYKAAAGLGTDKLNTVNASVAKLFVSESFINSATDSMQIFGARGYLKEYGIEQIMRDSLASTVYSGTSEIQRNIISKFLEL